MPTAQDFERLGAFYLGRPYDLNRREGIDEALLYDSKDLLTHAICVGMTGSGKTGLCLALIEEAAIDRVPVIAIDPKGDLANLLLTFPGLTGEEFAPWINEDDASQSGLSRSDWAARQAESWRNGLAKWGEDGERIQRLRDSAEFFVYTPGSSAGLPLSIVKSFAVPPASVLEDGELLRERVGTTVTSLLGLAGISADPLRSREHILLSTLIGESWKQEKDVDLASLIQAIQQPPLSKIGVMDVETFYPGKDRFELAMSLNGLLAAPGFSTWLEGDPLDIDLLLHSESGKPRVSIISIAHLNDSERMFIVSLLLNQVLGWVRQQSGTTSLRAIFYMDEIFGYFPPVANPPSKQPLLTLLKQSRAFGLGVVMATQNPVDLDYKGLSNIGTWFIGRLQTERDKARVIEGLEGASASQGARFDKQSMEETLAGLGNRIFLMNNVHEDKPVVMETRWVMSYLRGPLTRVQIKQLMDPIKTRRNQDDNSPMTPPSIKPQATAESPKRDLADSRPVIPNDIPQYFIPARQSGKLLYKGMVLGATEVHFLDARTGVDAVQKVALLAEITNDALPVRWETAVETSLDPNELEKEPDGAGRFAQLPQVASRAKSYATWSKDLSDFIFRNRTIDLLRSLYYLRVSNPDESERDFRVRLQQIVREKRDSDIERIRQKYAPKLLQLAERIRRGEQAVAREESEASGAKMDTLLGIGSTVLGALLGRKTLSVGNMGRAASTARSASRAMKQTGDVGRAAETLERYRQQRDELESTLNSEIEELKARSDPATEVFDLVQIKPKKKDISIKLIALVWAPFVEDQSGQLRPAWD